MKVKNTLLLDLIHNTRPAKVRNFVPVLENDLTYGGKESWSYIRLHYPSWQYNGIDAFDNILIWCERHFENDYIWNFEHIYFKTKEEQLIFTLRWGK